MGIAVRTRSSWPRPWGIVAVLCSACALLVVLAHGRDRERAPSVQPAPATGAPDAARAAELDELAPRPGAPVSEASRADAERVEPTPSEPGAGESHPRLRVTVLDALERRPIEGAEVMLLDRATPGRRRTDEHGVCVLPLQDEERADRLRVTAVGYCPGGVVGPFMGSETIYLAPAVTLFGRVLDAANGRPVAGASITLLCDDEEARAETTSGSEGEYELTDVPLASEATLELRAPRFALQKPTFVLRDDARRVRQDLRLVRGVELAGRVEDWMTGRGIAGASVSGLVTDVNGEFHGPVLTLPGSSWARIEVDAPGYVGLRGSTDLDEQAEHVFRLPRPATIAGEVRSSVGPVPRADVWFTAAGPVRAGAIQETSPLYELPKGWGYTLVAGDEDETGSDGRYGIDVLPWSLNGALNCSAPALDADAVGLRSIGEPGFDHRVDVWMEPSREPTRVWGSVRVNGLSLPVQGTVAWRGATANGSAALDEGRFTAVVEPGVVRLVATLALLPNAPSEEVSVELVAGEQGVAGLDVAAPIRTITGRVVTRTGRALRGAEIYALAYLPSSLSKPLQGPSYRARAEADGDYVLHVMDLGVPYDLTLLGFDGQTYVHEGIPAGARDVDFTVPDGQCLLVRVVDGTTGAVLLAGQQVEVLFRTTGRFWPLGWATPTPDAEGWTEFRTTERELELLALPRAAAIAGAVLRARHGTALKRVRFEGHEAERVELVLQRGTPLALELAEDAQPWPEDHALYLVEEELWDALRWKPVNVRDELDDLALGRHVRFDGGGRAQLAALAPGRYRFKVLPAEPAWRVAPESVLVEPGMLPLVVDWTRGE